MGAALGDPLGALIEVLHWSALLASAFTSFLLFRDLADVSQWLVQTPRHT